MGQSFENPHAFLDWEGLQAPLRVTRLSPAAALPAGSSVASVSRDESYRLRCDVEGLSSDPAGPYLEFQTQHLRPFEFAGVSGGFDVTLSNCYSTEIQVRPDSDSRLYAHNSFRLGVHTDRVDQKAAGHWSETAHIDWFINGPRGFVFTRKTFHQRDHGYLRKVEGAPEFAFCSGASLPSGSVDCALVKLPGFSFLIRGVPVGFGPSWSKSIGIEYTAELSSIPDTDRREAVAEIVSFVLGRRLISVGDTSLGAGEFPFYLQNWDNPGAASTPKGIKPHFAFQMRSWNPRGINVGKLCSEIDFPPIPVDRLRGKGAQNIESVLASLVPAYLERRRLYALDDALWRYWTFQELPLGVNLPMLVNGFEILARAWFESPRTESHGSFTPKQEFVSLLRADFDEVRRKLEEAATTKPSMSRLQNRETLDALMRRLENSFEMGQNARIRAFFRELGLEPTEAQVESMDARNKQIHGDSPDREPSELWGHSENLRTLFYQIVLRLLDYSGEYLDWALQEPAVKRLSAPA